MLGFPSGISKIITNESMDLHKGLKNARSGKKKKLLLYASL